MNAKKILISVLVLGLLAGAYIWFFVYNKAHKDYQEAESAFVGDANALLSQATENSASFIDTYMNQAVEVEGIVGDVGTQSFTLGSGLICTLDPNVEQELPGSGEIIKLKGRVVGIEDDLLTGDLLCNLDQCVILTD
jgi:hypothetical protein